jgi:uncharacterized protein (DUF1697 family)
MALVVLLRGVNVGGHRTFRPTTLAEQLRHLNAVNIGAAGTFVIRQPVTQSRLRAEVTRRLPFDAEVIICKARELAGLLAQDYFTDQPDSIATAVRAFVAGGPMAVAVQHSGESAVAQVAEEALAAFASSSGDVTLPSWYRVVLARG